MSQILPLVQKESANDEVKELMFNVESQFGFIPNLIKVFATSPATLKAYLTLGSLLEETLFTAEEQQIILLTVSRDNRHDYCMAVHSMISAKIIQMDFEKLNAIRQGKPVDDEKHRALIEFTETVVNERGYADQNVVKKFIAAGYSDQHVLEVILGVTMKTLSNYINHIADTPIDSQFSNFSKSQNAVVTISTT